MLLLCLMTASTSIHAQSKAKYIGSIELQAGKDNSENIPCVGFTTVHGVQFNPHIFLGGGISVNQYTKRQIQTHIPVFGDIKVNVLKTRLNPYLDIRGGYNFVKYDGLFLAPGIGMDYRVDRWTSVNVRYSYMLQLTSKQDHVTTGYASHMFVVGYSF